MKGLPDFVAAIEDVEQLALLITRGELADIDGTFGTFGRPVLGEAHESMHQTVVDPIKRNAVVRAAIAVKIAAFDGKLAGFPSLLRMRSEGNCELGPTHARRQGVYHGLDREGLRQLHKGATLRIIFHAPVQQVLGFPGSAEQRADADPGIFAKIELDLVRLDDGLGDEAGFEYGHYECFRGRRGHAL